MIPRRFLLLACIALTAACASRDRAPDGEAFVDAGVATRATASDPARAMRAIAGHRALRAIVAPPATPTLGAPARTTLAAALPEDASQPLVLSPVAAGDGALSIVAEDVAPSAAQVLDGARVHLDVAPSTDLVLTRLADRVEELRVLRDERAPTTFRWRLRTRGSLRAVRLVDGRVEVVDAAGVVRLAAARLVAWDADDRERPLSVRLEGEGDRRTLVAQLDARGLRYPIVVDPLWSTLAAPSLGPRENVVAKLVDGRAMAFGGYSPYWSIYDPIKKAWTPSGTLPFTTWPGAVAGLGLADGTVLAVGGNGDDHWMRWNGTAWVLKSTTNVYGCSSCTLAQMKDGRVLKVNNAGGNAELWDPSTEKWSATASLGASPMGPLRLVALTGGTHDGDVFGIESTMGQYGVIFRHLTNSWSTISLPGDRLTYPAIAALLDGRVVIASQVQGGSTPPQVVYVYDPGTNSSTASSINAFQRQNAGAALLPSGKVLFAGGELGVGTSADIVYTDAAIFDPATMDVTFVDAMPAPQAEQGMLVLNDGSVLSVGGVGQYGAPQSVAFLFTELANGQSCVYPAKPITCASGNCVDGVCCASASCPHGTCNGSKPGTCTKDVGEKCTANADCTSTFCVDGYCCNGACNGQCEACNGAGTEGTCTAVAGAPVGGRPACGGNGAGTPCGATCDGTTRTTCVYLPAGSTPCGADTCVAGAETKASTCDGKGDCPTTSTSCGAYACGPTACKRSCAVDVDCADGFYCLGATCVPKVGLGSACTTTSACPSGMFCTDGVCCGVAACGAGQRCDAAVDPAKKGTCLLVAGQTCAGDGDCGSGFCVDGVCCDRRCEGQCEACDLPATKGTCSPVSGAPHGSRPACSDGGGDVCKALECDGAKDPTSCQAFASGGKVVCKPASCGVASVVPPSTCDGAGTCVTPPQADCGNYACDPGALACKTSCADDADCKSGYVCRNGACTNGATCSFDRSTSTATDGTVSACAPYLCTTDGTCATRCATSDDCSGGTVCDGAGQCTASAPSATNPGGCAIVDGRTSGAGWLGGLALAALSLRRRRAERGARSGGRARRSARAAS